jgi:glycosyltransferase involved in cell wall biosynthesis
MPTLAAQATFAAPTIAVTHGCVATWWEAAHDTPLAADYHWHRAMTGKGLRAVDRVVAPSAAYAATVARHYRLSPDPHVIRNGRRPFAVATRAPHDQVFTAGRLWDRVKGTDILEAAAARIGIPFLAAGPTTGPHGETVSPAHLVTLGNLDERALAARLAAQPVFVSAATFEPFGLAVLEAAAAGCPLILSDIATFRELWEGAALFVDAQDAGGFADAIETVVGDAGRRHALSTAAATRALRYRPEAMARDMARLYAETLASAAEKAAA